MDEPFSALDVQTRAIMSTELLQPVGPDQAGGRLRHARPRGGHRPRRQGRRHHRRPGHRQGGVRDRPAAAARRPGDPLRPDASPGSTSRSGRRCAPRSPRPTPGRPGDGGGVMIDTPTDTSAGRRRPGRAVPPSRSVAAQRSSPRRRAARRRLALGRVRLGIVVVLLVALAARASTPSSSTRSSGVSPRACGPTSTTWFTVGTSQGSLGAQILVTLEEAVLGFVIGVDPRRRLRHRARPRPAALRAVRALPQGRRTRSRASSWARSSWSPSASASSPRSILAVVLVFFGVFFNAFQGAREVDRNLIANARILGASPLAGHPRRRPAVGLHLDPREPAHQLRLRPHRRAGRRDPRRQPGPGPAHPLVAEQLRHERRARRAWSSSPSSR